VITEVSPLDFIAKIFKKIPTAQNILVRNSKRKLNESFFAFFPFSQILPCSNSPKESFVYEIKIIPKEIKIVDGRKELGVEILFTKKFRIAKITI